MNLLQVLFLCLTLHSTFGGENKILNLDLKNSVKQVRFLLTPQSYARIECIFADVNSPLDSYTDDDLKIQLDHIYNTLLEEELVMLSDFFLNCSYFCKSLPFIKFRTTWRSLNPLKILNFLIWKAILIGVNIFFKSLI
jgi:hypothetical protein